MLLHTTALWISEGAVYSFLFVWLYWFRSHYVVPTVLEWLYRLGWPWTYNAVPISTSWIQGLNTFIIMSNLGSVFSKNAFGGPWLEVISFTYILKFVFEDIYTRVRLNTSKWPSTPAKTFEPMGIPSTVCHIRNLSLFLPMTGVSSQFYFGFLLLHYHIWQYI